MKPKELLEPGTLSTLRRVQATTTYPKLSDLMTKAGELPTPTGGLRRYKPLLHKLKDEKG